MFKQIVAAYCLVSAALLSPAARAQDNWPSKPVRITVNTGSGSGADVTARAIAEHLRKAFGQPFIVDFRPGANGILGSDTVAKAAPDGYNLLFTYTAAHVVNPAVYAKLPYDPLKDFTPVAQVGALGTLLVVSSKMPVNNLAEYVAYVKAHPNTVACGSWGIGSGGHLAIEALKQHTGADINHVPYKSGPAALTDVIGGQIHSAVTSVTGGLPMVQSGQLKAIAVAGHQRVPQLPDVKTMGEQGVPFNIDGWYGVMAPAGTPKPIVLRLNQEINRFLSTAANNPQLGKLGFSGFPLKNPDEFAETVRNDLKTWGDVALAAKVQVE